MKTASVEICLDAESEARVRAQYPPEDFVNSFTMTELDFIDLNLRRGSGAEDRLEPIPAPVGQSVRILVFRPRSER